MNKTIEQRLIDIMNSHGLEVTKITFEPKGEKPDGRRQYRYTIECQELDMGDIDGS